MMISKTKQLELVSLAQKARVNAYCPYSDFAVGAALLAESGKIYTGVNCENASLGATICAERAALTSAISAGERRFVAIAVAAGKQPVSPCGICRQVLAEFGNIIVLCAAAQGEDYKIMDLSALLPDAFVEYNRMD
ncbi:MAG: cytidine deaminase [Oscillospiraceae bacterium]|jgi:cytidine deaminase|nr:cytidine deaminase [Oscillospiraceae bacterium]